MFDLKKYLTENRTTLNEDAKLDQNKKIALTIRNELYHAETFIRRMRQRSGFNERVLEKAQRATLAAVDALTEWMSSADGK